MLFVVLYLKFRLYLTILVFFFTLFRMCPVCCPLLFVFVCLFACSVSLKGHFAVASSRQSTAIELLLLFRILFHLNDNVLLSIYVCCTSPLASCSHFKHRSPFSTLLWNILSILCYKNYRTK